MRICILARSIPPRVTDGIARNRWLYAKQLQKLGWEVHLITAGVKNLEDYRDGIYVHEVAVDENDSSNIIINSLVKDELDRYDIAYSYAVYKRIQKLIKRIPIDVVDQALWGFEGLITRIKLPYIPMITRVDTTSRLISEINFPGQEPEFSERNRLEQFMLQNSNALVFNSWSILTETKRLYETDFEHLPYAVIYHGIEFHPHLLEEFSNDNSKETSFKVLIPGRLEKRKGTPVVINHILPELLKQENNVQVHFVGKDNAEWDGFLKEQGVSYTNYISSRFKKEIGKRIFIHGYLSDNELNEHYQSADCILVPSLYESFGLVYLEALAFGKPLLAFQAGAAAELLEHEKEALLVSPREPETLAQHILRLQHNKELAATLASNGLQKLKSHFTADRMARQYKSFVEEVLLDKENGTVYQLMNGLTEGDGVSYFVRDYDYILKENGHLTQIIGNNASGSLKPLSAQIHTASFKENDVILYHYCGHCEWAEFINSLEGPKKILFFHNITPPHFFKSDTSEYHSAYNGLQQVEKLDNFDLYVALSDYSLQILQQMLPNNIEKMIMPQLLDRELIVKRPYNKELAAQLRNRHPFHIIFVGRVVAHKKQSDIIRFAQYYKAHCGDQFHVSIIGGGAESYFKELEALIRRYNLAQQVTITGKISDEDLYAYYRSAHVYLSMSEHEGFGTPLVEAMVFEVPVVAFGITAIPETIGDNGCVFYEKDMSEVAEIVHKLKTSDAFRKDVLQKQDQQLQKYQAPAVLKKLEEMISTGFDLYSKRRNRLANSGRLFREEFINYRSPLFEKRGEWSVADGRTLIHYGHDNNSYLTLSADFYEADLFLVNNAHSGMVAVYLNNEEVLTTDLYNPLWIVKRYRIVNKAGSLRNIKIVPLSIKNERSSGKEVLVYGIVLRKAYRQSSNSAVPEGRIRIDINNQKPAMESTATDESVLSGNPQLLRQPGTHSTTEKKF